MSLRFALLLLMASLCAGCVLSGDYNPMKTSKGRDEARAAYVQLGLGYLQQGMTERAKVPLKKALELDGSDPDANAALGLVFQAEMEPKLADGIKPIDPTSAAAASLRMSPNMFVVSMTSNCAGFSVSCIAALSTYMCSRRTSGCAEFMPTTVRRQS